VACVSWRMQKHLGSTGQHCPRRAAQWGQAVNENASAGRQTAWDKLYCYQLLAAFIRFYFRVQKINIFFSLTGKIIDGCSF